MTYIIRSSGFRVKKLFFYLFISIISLNISAQPVITTFTPASGPVGASVTITGANFSSTLSDNTVFFGAVKAGVTAATANSLSVTVPSGASYMPVTVTVNGLTAYSLKPFVVTFTGGGNINPTTFETNVDFTTDLHPNGLAITDLDGDGKPDIITPNNYSTTGQPASISILRNTSVAGGAVSFAPKMDINNGVATYAIASGDFDGDGKPDIVACSIGDANISIFRNTSITGTISFAAKVDYATNGGAHGIAVGDLDGDGKPDITVVNYLSGSMSVYRNTSSTGIISFAPKVDFTTSLGPESIVIGDMDGDSKPDIAISNSLANSFSTFRNTSTTGSISFGTRTDITCGSGNDPRGLLLADLDGDNKLDVYLVIFNNSTGNSATQIFKNISTAGNLTFSFATSISGSVNDAYHIAAGDINGDGKPDLAFALTAPDKVKIFQNNSTPGVFSFAESGQFGAFSPYAADVADLNGDSKPDLLTTFFTSDRVSVFKNRCGLPGIASFTPATTGAGGTVTISGYNFTGVTAVTFGGIPAASFTVVDANTITAVVGTGATGDVVVTAPSGSASIPGFIFYVPPPAPVITSFTPASVAAGATVTITGNNFTSTSAVSFGGIAATSFIVVNATTITAVVGTGATGLVSVTTPGGTATLGGFVFIPPPVISSFTPVSGTIGATVTITGNNFINVTDVKFGGIPAASFSTVSATTITAVVLEGSSGAVSVQTPGGTASLAGFTFIVPPTPVITSFSPVSGITGTMVTITGANFSPVAQNNIVYFGAIKAVVSSATATSLTVIVPNGATYQPISVTTNYRTAFSSKPFGITFPGGGGISSSSFEKLSGFSIGNSPQDVCIGDYDGDGKSDVATANYGGHNISVLRNTSSAGVISFDNKIDYQAGNFPWNIISTDADGDGKLDIWVLNKGDRNFSVLLNLGIPGSFNFAPRVNITVSPTEDPLSMASGDFDGDGKTDVAIGNINSISVLKNTSVAGNISFAPRIDYPAGFIVNGITTGDVDGDGKADIVCANGGNDTVSIFRNTSSGGIISFAPRVNYTTRHDFSSGFGPIDVFISDLDNDGKPDIAIANTALSHSVSVLKNNSTPGVISFPSRSDFMTDNIMPINVGVDDLDGDGKPDLALIHEYVPAAISLLKNTSTAGVLSFQNHVDYSDNLNSTNSGVAIGDLDGDNMPEVITTYASNGNTPTLTVYKNKTNGPHITSFTPTNGVAGTTITITGLNFTAATLVSFGGIAAASFVVNSPTSITAIVGTGASGNVNVTTPLGTVNAPGFLYGLLPYITSFTPTSAALSSAVTITGTNFTGVTAVSFGGVAAQSFTVNSSTSISATVWIGASGSVSVTGPGGTASLPGFTYIPPGPAISSFFPQTGNTGTVVSISGSNFTGATAVSFGGVNASSFTVFGQSLINAVVANGATGSVNVTSPNGTGTLSGFTYVAQAPTITSFTPTAAATGTTVTITGNNFTNTSSVSFGGIPASSFTVVNATTITAVAANGASGSVSVTTPGGTAALTGFTFIAPPIISSFAPATAATGSVVTITGNNFNGATAVKFGGTNAVSFTVVNSTAITALVANGSSGNISVTTPGGTAASAGFTFINPPQITSYTPTTATANTVVTITGNNFTGTTAVKFGGINAVSFTVINATTITAVVANGASGSISVTAPGGTAIIIGFVYNNQFSGGGSNNSGELIINPNPAKDIVTVKHPAAVNGAFLKLIDIAGRKVKVITIDPNVTQTSLSVKGLANGIYKLIWKDDAVLLRRTLMIAH